MNKISIITPVFNGEKYLRASIDSVLAQTYPEWELIVIDDGSTDSTPEILSQYNDRRIRKVRQENRGEAAARNAGLDLASGAYLAFLDADDTYLPNALADLAGILDQQPEFDVVYANGYICDAELNRLMELTDIRPGLFSGDILEQVVLYSGVVTVPVCTLTRLEAVKKTGSRFDPDLVIGPDWDFWIQLARHVSFGYADKITCCYRIHATNITRTSGAEKRQRDLIRGRLKVMNSAWFPQLSLSTRQEFFYTLLADLSRGLPDIQKDIVSRGPFTAIPDKSKAFLLRQCGIACLRNPATLEDGLWFLDQALSVSPGDLKTQILKKVFRLHPAAANAVIRFWHTLHQFGKRIVPNGKPAAKEVPSDLKPVEN